MKPNLLEHIRARIMQSQNYFLQPLEEEREMFLDYITRILKFHEPSGEAGYPTSPWRRGSRV